MGELGKRRVDRVLAGLSDLTRRRAWRSGTARSGHDGRAGDGRDVTPNWRFWPCDANGNKVRYPTNEQGRCCDRKTLNQDSTVKRLGGFCQASTHLPGELGDSGQRPADCFPARRLVWRQRAWPSTAWSNCCCIVNEKPEQILSCCDPLSAAAPRSSGERSASPARATTARRPRQTLRQDSQSESHLLGLRKAASDPKTAASTGGAWNLKDFTREGSEKQKP